MAIIQYDVIKAKKLEFPVRNLLEISGDRNLIASLSAFGPNTYLNNLREMQKDYSHPSTGERISFSQATTAESILIASCGFGSKGEFDAKRDIFDPRWLQLGYTVRTQDGVFTNTEIINEKSLKELLNNAEKVNGIYLINEKSAFAPYESFKRGVQDCDTFAQGGLARALEHAKGKEAEILKTIASPKFYKKGIDVSGFDPVKEPVLKVADLYSDRDIVDCRLGVGGYGWGGSDGGFAFGVLNKSAFGRFARF